MGFADSIKKVIGIEELDEDEMVNAESKLYLWNNSTQVTAIKNILISETAV